MKKTGDIELSVHLAAAAISTAFFVAPFVTPSTFRAIGMHVEILKFSAPIFLCIIFFDLILRSKQIHGIKKTILYVSLYATFVGLTLACLFWMQFPLEGLMRQQPGIKVLGMILDGVIVSALTVLAIFFIKLR